MNGVEEKVLHTPPDKIRKEGETTANLGSEPTERIFRFNAGPKDILLGKTGASGDFFVAALGGWAVEYATVSKNRKQSMCRKALTVLDSEGFRFFQRENEGSDYYVRVPVTLDDSKDSNKMIITKMMRMLREMAKGLRKASNNKPKPPLSSLKKTSFADSQSETA
jgi:hypothetical protein